MSPRASCPPDTTSLLTDPDAPGGDGRRIRGDITRSRILRSALQSASLQGLNGVTIGQVADAAGVSKGHIGILFGNRENLQLATIDAAVNVFREHVLADVERAKTAQAKLTAYCLGWFDYVNKRVLPGGCLITAATSEFRTMEGAVREKLLELRKERILFLHRLADEAQAECEIKKSKTELDDFVYQIIAYEAAANVACLLGDTAAFEHAWRATNTALARFRRKRQNS
jgi:AcrR family transcriptional regulator